MDYFNCEIGEKGPFRALCRSTTIREEVVTSTADAFQFMSSRDATPAADTNTESSGFSDIESLLKKSPNKPFVRRPQVSLIDDDEDEDYGPDESCCPYHAWTTFNAWKDDLVAEQYDLCCDFARRRMFGAPLLLLGQELVINEKQVEIVGDRILFTPWVATSLLGSTSPLAGATPWSRRRSLSTSTRRFPPRGF